ncbi:hypothetical protein FA95DRAFT_1585006 [Auriscalpium vulgare]|uniref:Uncharacterized protein n=1 Tax=Auriscalpium vulgare TaxID=40419 RepID=A0ACB8R8U0_9AGAM|nr:hypothetical protein FA95DRAFT_1585006 [Auriscalpium vulgare]
MIAHSARVMIRELSSLGIPQAKITQTARTVLRAAGITVDGDVTRHSIARIVREGYVAAVVQVMDRIRESAGWTGSADGTSHKHIEHLSHHMYLHAPRADEHASVQPSEMLFLGVRATPSKTSEAQLEEFSTMLFDFIATYNKTCLGRANPMSLHDVLSKLTGWGSDHAEDQKKFFRLLREWKRVVDREHRGEQSLHSAAESSSNHVALHLLQAIDAKITSLGGPAAWDALSAAEREAVHNDVHRDMRRTIGEAAFNALPADEKRRIDLIVWAGCAMHKELNSVKGGNTAMKAYWTTVEDEGPVLLMNRDNAAVAAAASSDAAGQSDAERRAHAVSEGGGVKLTSLAGLVFNQNDDKKGQQDTFRIFFEHALGFVVHFPETSNTRFQTHCTAACELLVHLPLYIQFLEIVRDKKDKRNFNNMENNIYKGLTDIPTITELAVLALYSQAISHPYMRTVRGPDGNKNALTLGGFHYKVIEHCEAIIANPDLLLSPSVSHTTGSLDGKLWERPEVIYAVQHLMPTLPHLRGALVAFFQGALETWKRFSSRARLAAVRATNDLNESALGQKRVIQRRAPNKSELTYNAERMYSANRTGAWAEEHLSAEAWSEVRKITREMDESGMGKKKRAEIIEADQKHAKANREKDAAARAKVADRNAKLDAFTPVLDVEYWVKALGDRSVTLQQHINPQLQWHKRDDSKTVGTTSKSTREDKINKIIAAIKVLRWKRGTV